MKTGLEVLHSEQFRRLQGRKIGLVTHPAAALPDGTQTIEALQAAGIKLTALFGPEHGVRGTVPAGKWIASSIDKKSGIPAYSLYGKTKVPTATMLKGIELLVLDLQDIGCRSYTYLSTLGCVLEGAARHRVPVLLLDRPNPLGLIRVEGGPVKTGYFSFVSKYPTAYRHGMTLGELAAWLVGTERLPNRLQPELTVIACAGLRRADAGWDERQWIPTSPNVPTLRAARLYAATGIVGELDQVSIGVGTRDPFGYFGSPTLDSKRLLAALDRVSMPGFAFVPATFTPSKGVFSGRRCLGVQLTAVQAPGLEWTYPNFVLLAALRDAGISNPFTSGEATRMFDYSCGSSAVRRAFARGAGASVLWQVFNEGVSHFMLERRSFLHPAYS